MHLVGFVGWLHFQIFHTKLSYICVSELQSANKLNFPVRCLETGVRLQYRLEGLFVHFFSLLLSLFLCFPFFFTLQTLKIALTQCASILSLVIPCHNFIILSELDFLHCPRNCVVGLATSPLLAKVGFSQLSVLWKDVGKLYLHDLVCKHLPQAGLFSWLFPFSTISPLLPFLSIVSKSYSPVLLVITKGSGLLGAKQWGDLSWPNQFAMSCMTFAPWSVFGNVAAPPAGTAV